MNVIDANSLEKSYGSRLVLGGITLALAEGEKVGLIGRNGCGKSTLLRMLAGLEAADSGEIRRKRGLSVEYLPQEPILDGALTIRQTLEAGLNELEQNRRRFQEIAMLLPELTGEAAAKLGEEQHRLQDWLDLHQGWNVDHKVELVCARLGIADLEQVVGTLSGGWRKRVALAGALLREPELLLLDEPTNHLDADTVAWLEQALRVYPGAVMLVTHDRYFLDRVVTRMFELDGGDLALFQGGYSAYLEQKQERLAQAGRTQSRLANLLRREEEWLRRGPKARTTKQKARIDRVADLQTQRKTIGDREVQLSFTADRRLGGTILEFEQLAMERGGRRLLDDFSFILRQGERIGILGPNGCGKTSLLKTVLGELTPVAGKVVQGRNTCIGYLDQQRSGLDPEQYVHEALGEGDWVTLAGQRRHKVGYLEDFLFTREEQRKRIVTLSGGERARLLLAKLMLEGANLLILDEPTNDLDIPTMQVLEEAFNQFPGCILVVTHDRWFLDRVASGILHFEENNRITVHEGNYDDFRRRQAQQTEKPVSESKPTVKGAAEPPRPRKRAGLSYKEQRELEAVETEIAERETELSWLEGLLADPAGMTDGVNHLEQIARQFGVVEARLAELMGRWEALELKKSADSE